MCGIRMATDKILTRQQKIIVRPSSSAFFYFRPFFLKPFFAGFFIALSGAHYWFLASPANFFQDDSNIGYAIRYPNFRKIRSLTRDSVQMAPDSRNVQRQAPGVCVVHLFVLAKADMDFL